MRGWKCQTRLGDMLFRRQDLKKAETLHTTDLFVLKMAQHATHAHESFVCLTVPVTAPLEGFYGEKETSLEHRSRGVMAYSTE